MEVFEMSGVHVIRKRDTDGYRRPTPLEKGDATSNFMTTLDGGSLEGEKPLIDGSMALESPLDMLESEKETIRMPETNFGRTYLTRTLKSLPLLAVTNSGNTSSKCTGALLYIIPLLSCRLGRSVRDSPLDTPSMHYY